MSMFIEPGLYIRICPVKPGPLPHPLDSGFDLDTAYRVLGGFTMSESAEMFFMLANNAAQVWFISNRHCRAHAVHPELTSFSYSLTEN